jgi:hypothetical protein
VESFSDNVVCFSALFGPKPFFFYFFFGYSYQGADHSLGLKYFDWVKRFSVEFELTNQRVLLEEHKDRTFPITSTY